MKTVVLFGGTGFIGTHLAQHLLKYDLSETIFLVDLDEPRELPFAQQLQAGILAGKVIFVSHDVRKPVPLGLLPSHVDLVFNLAAVHREPGHVAQEYFDTNLPGAHNVCDWADAVGCDTIIFTSSISPYGPSETKKTEASVPAPETAYGTSKLAAEKIHQQWQQAKAGRKLLILRPGVVFGAGEGGNVSRLLRSLVKGYFVYLGNRQTVKSAGYVKELCFVIMFGLDKIQGPGEPTLLINFSLDPPPTVEELVETILKVLGRNQKVFSLPRSLLLGVSYPLSAAGRIFGVKLPINPIRIRKLIRSNNVWPAQLKALGYKYTYTLESAFCDWRNDAPEDFQR